MIGRHGSICFLEFQSSFAETLGTSGRFVLASLIAYFVAQTLDAHLFHWLRGRFEPKWMRIKLHIICDLDRVIPPE